MPQNSLQTGSPLIAIAADSEQKVIYVHEEMQTFLRYPVSDCSGMELSEVIWDIAEQRMEFKPDERSWEVFFSKEGEEYRLAVQRIPAGIRLCRKSPLYSKRAGTGKKGVWNRNFP